MGFFRVLKVKTKRWVNSTMLIFTKYFTKRRLSMNRSGSVHLSFLFYILLWTCFTFSIALIFYFCQKPSKHYTADKTMYQNIIISLKFLFPSLFVHQLFQIWRQILRVNRPNDDVDFRFMAGSHYSHDLIIVISNTLVT